MGNLTLVFILFHLPTISKTAVLVSGSSSYKEAIVKSISAALWGSDGFTWLNQKRFLESVKKKKKSVQENKNEENSILTWCCSCVLISPSWRSFSWEGLLINARISAWWRTECCNHNRRKNAPLKILLESIKRGEHTRLRSLSGLSSSPVRPFSPTITPSSSL